MSGLDVLTLAEFLAEPPPADSDDMVDGLLPSRGVVVLAGARKSMKSMLSAQAGLAIAGGRAGVFGRRVGRPGPVLYVLEEGVRHKFAERLTRQLAGLELTEPPKDFIVSLFNRVKIDETDAWSRLRETVGELRPVLVVLDTLVYLHSQDENDNSSMTRRVMARLVELAVDFDCLVVAIHHVTKPSERRAHRASDRIRGAGGIAGASDANLVIERVGANGIRVQAEFRDAEDVECFLELDPDTLLLGEAAAPGPDRKVPRDQVVKFVVSAGRPVGKRDAAEEWGVSRNTAFTALMEAAEAGEIDHYAGARGAHLFIPFGGPVNAPD